MLEFFYRNTFFYRTPPVAASVRWNIEKSTTINSEGLKRGTKRLNMKNTQIFHSTWPFQTVFTCPNSIIKAENHCAKYVQSETKNKFCKIKFIQMCSVTIIFTSLHSLNLSFPLLSYFISTAIPKFPPWFCTSPPWIPAFFEFPSRFQTMILRK